MRDHLYNTRLPTTDLADQSTMPSSNSSPQSLRLYLGLGLIAWVATFLMVHGPGVILPYLAIQIVTSGVFAFFMWRTEKTIEAGDSDLGDDQST